MRAICGVQHRHRKRSRDLMLMLGLNEAIDHQLATANIVCWYGHALRREDVHVLIRALDLEVEGQRKGGLRGHGRRVKVGLRMEDAPCRSKCSIGIQKIAAWLR